ncbi:Abi-alpha family protein [Chitinophaga sp. YIM B06452]|uniref:Abi-alpha family protein n=1 Tax=Chitinophaga sp. YIM B06452 TaxID=3082158 RepID=UPI0031FE9E6E
MDTNTKLIYQDAIENIPESERLPLQNPIALRTLAALEFYEKNSSHAIAFTTLMQKSFDKRNVKYIHPSYITILLQLTEDELSFIKIIQKEGTLEYVTKLDLTDDKSQFCNRRYLKDPLPEKQLNYPEMKWLYIDNLLRLNIINYPIYKQDPVMENGAQIGLIQQSRIHLTNFGNHFFEAITN